MSGLHIAESIHGTWFYHWRRDGEILALCGARVMLTQIPADAWGHVGHLNERYCKVCAVNADKEGK